MIHIPYGRQSISNEDIQAVVDVLQSDWLTQGPAIERFESAIAAYCGARYAVAVSHGTAALHAACLALDVGPGDRLWTSPNSFVASANCARYCGAEVDFVDINPATYNLDTEQLAARLAEAARKNQLPKVIVPVHFAGQSCQMDQISALAKQYDVAVLEDAAHALGGKYRGQTIGGCSFSDVAIYSFHPVKSIATGEGGVLVTNREDLYLRLRQLRHHGIVKNEAMLEDPDKGGWYYEQVELGYNFRLTDIQAALGWSQLQRLDGFIQKRQALAARYNELLADLPVICPWQHPDTESAWHLYVIRLGADIAETERKAVFNGLRARGIGVQVHYIPIHTQPYYRELGFDWGDFPEAEQYYREAISLPLYPALSESDQFMVVDALKASLQSIA